MGVTLDHYIGIMERKLHYKMRIWGFSALGLRSVMLQGLGAQPLELEANRIKRRMLGDTRDL